MKTSIATVCLSGGLSEKLEAIAAAGFRGVEIFENDLLSYNGTPADVARKMADLGLKVITFQPFRDFEGMPEPQRARAFDRAERGEYLQLYTQSFKELFFFEIVERKGYKGCGAINAPIRLNAQRSIANGAYCVSQLTVPPRQKHLGNEIKRATISEKNESVRRSCH